MDNSDLEYSVERLLKSEKQLAEDGAFGLTKQGKALRRKCMAELKADIAGERKRADDKDVWRALKGLDDETIATRLLVNGISLADSKDLGVDRKTGVKVYRECATWLGRCFNCSGVEGLRVGTWGINRLVSLDAFTLDADDILCMTAEADDFMHEVLASHVQRNPFLSPIASPPEDWTKFHQTIGGWTKVSLIRNAKKPTEDAVRRAIGAKRMRPVLDAINWLQRVPFAINEPVLDFIKRAEPESVPEKPEIWQTEKFKKWQRARTAADGYVTDTTIAEAMAVASRFWVPLSMESRGRIFGIPHFNFQRDDRTRALFLFADGEAIGGDGLQYLKSHVAKTANGNAWSTEERPGDLDFKKRIAWVDDSYNSEIIRRVGETVINREGPAKIRLPLPKDQYQFVAACAELCRRWTGGPTSLHGCR
jgi:hypothetical protein